MLITGEHLGSIAAQVEPQLQLNLPVDVQDQEAELLPGLIAEYSSLSDLANSHLAPSSSIRDMLMGVDPKPAFTWGDSSPHPRLKSGPFQVKWIGLLDLRRSDELRFSAFVCGEIHITVAKTIVLQGQGRRLDEELLGKQKIVLDAGLHAIEIVFKSTAHSPARIQVSWEGNHFAKEPLPASRLRHLQSTESNSLLTERTRDMGRGLVKQLGCARCHQDNFPGIPDELPGPSLAHLKDQLTPMRLMRWLASPAKEVPGARMPILFASDRHGYVERWLITQYLLKNQKQQSLEAELELLKSGDSRNGRQHFLGLGCLACHVEPNVSPPESKEGNTTHRWPLHQLADRYSPSSLSSFLKDPHSRYPDGRMPKFLMTPTVLRDLVSYLLQDFSRNKPANVDAPSEDELKAFLRQQNTTNPEVAGRKLLVDKGCVRCHSGLKEASPPRNSEHAFQKLDIAESGCLSKSQFPRYGLNPEQCKNIKAYLQVAAKENHPSPFFQKQQLLHSQGCLRCHQRDSDHPSPLEEIGRTVWTPHLFRLPFQRTPSLTQSSAKFQHAYLQKAIGEGVSGVRPDWYSYRMPVFGDQAPALVNALIAGDGDLPDTQLSRPPSDPNALTLGSSLVGFSGYGCISCHVWKGKSLAATEPSAVGPDLCMVTERIKRNWFNRYVNDPRRIYPNSPMPSIFTYGERASLHSILDGDSTKQKEALWTFLSAGKHAPDPQPKKPLELIGPTPLAPVYVAQVPLLLDNQKLVEGLAIWLASGDVILFDVGGGFLEGIYSHAKLLRHSNMWRTIELKGFLEQNAFLSFYHDTAPKIKITPNSREFLGYQFLTDRVRLRWRFYFDKGSIDWTELVQVHESAGQRRVRREINTRMPTGLSIVLEIPRINRNGQLSRVQVVSHATEGQALVEESNQGMNVLLRSNPRTAKLVSSLDLVYSPREPNQPNEPAVSNLIPPVDDGVIGPLSRPGYRAILFPRPKTAQNEDLVMPSALAVDPRKGTVFVASMKQGDLLAVDDPNGDGKAATFRNCARGLFQDCFGMLHDGQHLYVLHRRNLSQLSDTLGQGNFDQHLRMTALNHSVGNAYDWAYGLVKDHQSRFFWTLAPHANPHQQGAGSLLRYSSVGEPPRTQEIAFGFRNPLGWSSGPDGEIFFTDNQGDWCATNKLCHVVEGRFYGYPNAAQPEHGKKAKGGTAVWVPYEWAKSINGLAYDFSGGKFGPFAGQFFMAELMNGGAIVRAQVEKVNGTYQGACFPFWGRGLLGPLCLAFDPQGRLYVGSITTPGWMGQPDRGALFRLEFTQHTPFEIQSIHVKPKGFQLVFTKPVDPKSIHNLSSFQLHHFHYEYTGAYGSPELDRTTVRVRNAVLHQDGRTVDLMTDALQSGKVYLISAPGVRSMTEESLVHPSGAYTLNEIPKD